MYIQACLSETGRHIGWRDFRTCGLHYANFQKADRNPAHHYQPRFLGERLKGQTLLTVTEIPSLQIKRPQIMCDCSIAGPALTEMGRASSGAAEGDAPLRSHCSLWVLEGHGPDDFELALLQDFNWIPTFWGTLIAQCNRDRHRLLKVLENRRKLLSIEAWKELRAVRVLLDLAR